TVLAAGAGAPGGAGSTAFSVSAAAADRLVFTTQPGSATAGSAFGSQPVLKSRDPFGNDSTVGLGASKLVTVTLSAGTGTLQGTATLDIGTEIGRATGRETDQRIDSAGSGKVLTASASGLSSVDSNAFSVAAAAADRLVFTTQPSSANAGSAFGNQPVLQIRYPFGNDSTVGLGASKLVTVTLSAGTGTLQGTATLDIGTGAGNGTVSYTNLRIDTAGSGKVLTASASGLSSVDSNAFSVSAAAADRLVFTTQPGSATAGSAFGSQPVLKSRDPFGNDSTVGLGASKLVPVTLSAGTGTLQRTATPHIRYTARYRSVSYTNLRIDTAGSGKVLTASASGLSSVDSNA